MPLLQTSGNVTADGYGGGVAAVPQYIEDVFSTYLYTGNGSTQTITNGIDLAGKGGMVWLKARTSGGSSFTNNAIIDTARGANANGYYSIYTNLTDGQFSPTGSSDAVATAVSSTGFTVGGNANVNYNTQTDVSWTFRKQPKFFDVVTGTQSVAGNVTFNHNLGSVPGCILLKATSTVTGGGEWYVYHRSLGTSQYLNLNTTDAASSAFAAWGGVAPTSTQFTMGYVYPVGTTVVAYLFAHDAGGFGLTGTDNVISCGSFTGTSFTVNLGYEPQWIMFKRSDAAGQWFMLDTMRGDSLTAQSYVKANASDAESTNPAAPGYPAPTSTGFYGSIGPSGAEYIYIAIRRGPMKVPTSGTSVYNADTTITATTPAAVSGFVTDLMISTNRTNKATYNEMFWSNRLTANGYTSSTNTTAEQAGGAFGAWDTMNGSGTSALQSAGVSDMAWMFRRAPSFFDEVCYTGNGSSNNAKTHNLGVAPELLIIKNRSSSGSGDWYTFHTFTSSNFKKQLLDTTDAQTNYTYGSFLDAQPTSTTFTVNSGAGCNESSVTYVAYLFATCAGVSKVGSYTGNGTTQTINCGFTGGARFVLIKRTDDAGDWYVYDTARGMTTLTDPYLRLNSTAAESATLGSVTTVSTGFALNASILAAINTNGASYIFLAIS